MFYRVLYSSHILEQCVALKLLEYEREYSQHK